MSPLAPPPVPTPVPTAVPTAVPLSAVPLPHPVEAADRRRAWRPHPAAALLAVLMLVAATDAQSCVGYGCENWPQHDGSSSEYGYPPPPPPPPPPRDGGTPRAGGGLQTYPGGAPKPDCSFCHAGLPARKAELTGASRYFPQTLMTNPSQFSRVHRLAAARAPDKRAFAKLRTQPQVPPALQPLYRAVAAR